MHLKHRNLLSALICVAYYAVPTVSVALTAETIRSVVRNGQGIMPPTRKSEITDQELDKLAAWLTRKN